MKFEKKDFKGQGALEYLLMIGLGVAVAAVVILFGFSIAEQQQCANAISQWDSMCGMIALRDTCEDRQIRANGVEDCRWDKNSERCVRITGDPVAGVPEQCGPAE